MTSKKAIFDRHSWCGASQKDVFFLHSGTNQSCTYVFNI